MVQITKQKIHLTRGDTLSLELNLTDVNGDPYEPEENDRVVFRLKKNALSDYMLIEQDIDLSTMTLTLAPEQTANLPFGHYKYEIEIISNSYNYTVFENEDFYLGRELSKSTKSVTPTAAIETISLDGVILPIVDKNVNIPLIETVNDALENGDIDITTNVTNIVNTAIQQEDINITAEEVSFENTQIPLPSIVDDNLLEAVQRLYSESVLIVHTEAQGNTTFENSTITLTQNQIDQLLRTNSILHIINYHEDNINIYFYPEIETRVFPPTEPGTGTYFKKYICKVPYIEQGTGSSGPEKQYVINLYADAEPTDSIPIEIEDVTPFAYIQEKNMQVDPSSPVVTNIILGNKTQSTGSLAVSESEGYTNNADAHAEGYNSTASGYSAHAEGNGTLSGSYAGHAEGMWTTAGGNVSHAEGSNTLSNGSYTHSEGYNTTALGTGTHVEGYGNCLPNSNASGAHAEGYYTTASNTGAHSEGQNTLASGPCAHAEGYNSSAADQYTHAEGYYTQALAPYSHAEGYYTTVVGSYNQGSHVEGCQTYIGSNSRYGVHAEGTGTTANAESAHAEGYQTLVSGAKGHAEGNNSKVVSGECGHAEGYYTYVTANGAHAEGGQTTASGTYAHSEGDSTLASGEYSHAEGNHTTAAGSTQHVEGSYNIADSSNQYIHIAGNGTASTASNAYTLSWDGTGWFANDVTIKSGANTVSLADLNTQVGNIASVLDAINREVV